jgi:outer membrane protein insertion porin family
LLWVSFQGNENFSEGELASRLVLKPKSVFSEKRLQEDLAIVLKSYWDDGYYLARIDSVDQTVSDDSLSLGIRVYISEGVQIEIGQLMVFGSMHFSQEEILKHFTTAVGHALQGPVLENDISQLIDMYERSGYPFAKVKIDEISVYEDSDRKKLGIAVRVDEGRRVQVSEIRVEGNETTRPDVITREAQFLTGGIFEQANIDELKRRLQRLDFLNISGDPELYLIGPDTSTLSGLIIRVKEGSSSTFDGILGYQPPRTPPETGYLTGLVNISMRNLLGTGRRADIMWHQQQSSTQELEMHYLEPWMFGFPVNGGFGFFQRRQDTSYVSRRIDLRCDAVVTGDITASLLFSHEKITPSALSPYAISESRTISGGAEIRYDSRDDPQNPLEGVFYRTNYQIGQKEILWSNIASISDQSTTIQKLTVDFEIFFELLSAQVVAAGLHWREVRSEPLELADMFRFGGTKTVRGYREDEFFGSRLLWSNLEYRFSLGQRSYLFGFLDSGYYLRPPINSQELKELRRLITGYGIGVSVATVLGSIGVSYALGEGDSFSRGKIHVGLINTF